MSSLDCSSGIATLIVAFVTWAYCIISLLSLFLFNRHSLDTSATIQSTSFEQNGSPAHHSLHSYRNLLRRPHCSRVTLGPHSLSRVFRHFSTSPTYLFDLRQPCSSHCRFTSPYTEGQYFDKPINCVSGRPLAMVKVSSITLLANTVDRCHSADPTMLSTRHEDELSEPNEDLQTRQTRRTPPPLSQTKRGCLPLLVEA